MNGKSTEQCCKRYNQSLRSGVRKGEFCEEEDHIITVGVWLFGESAWVRIADHLAGRTPSQLYSRFRNFLTADAWSADENRLLIELVHKEDRNAPDWAGVAAKFDGAKTKSQCKRQFKYLLLTFMRNKSDFDLESVPPRKTQLRRVQERKEKLEAALDEYFAQQQEQEHKRDETETEAQNGDEKICYTTSNGVSDNRYGCVSNRFLLIAYLTETCVAPEQFRIDDVHNNEYGSVL
jgi:hypothetical protein